MKAIFVVVMCLFVLSGCAGSPIAISRLTPQELKDVKLFDLCSAYAYAQSKDMEQELIKRGAVRKIYFPAIRAKNISLGFKRCELMATFGKPYDINSTISALGSHEQWVYKKSSYSYSYYYFENDSLVTIQN